MLKTGEVHREIVVQIHIKSRERTRSRRCKGENATAVEEKISFAQTILFLVAMSEYFQFVLAEVVGEQDELMKIHLEAFCAVVVEIEVFDSMCSAKRRKRRRKS